MVINETERFEKAVLIGIWRQETEETAYFLAEFRELVRAAGAVEAGIVTQVRPDPDPALFLGSGKADFLAETVREQSADLVISMQELSPVQIRNLEDLTGVRVVDRTDLILDIFAGRARTKEGKLQVELAQLNYMLPRLRQSGTHYSRLGGGIGTRGPGETKLEADRRRVRNRIAELRRELAEAVKHRAVQRHRREKNETPIVALVGYTNSGKSTLFNRLTSAGVSAADRLFETLDPVSRVLPLPGGREAVIMDTVGFISDLPHQLVAAFKATLEETVRSTLMLLVLDGSSPCLMRQYEAVRTVLNELGIETKERIVALNKCDLIDNELTVARMAKEWGAMPISALEGRGVNELLEAVERKVFGNVMVCRLLIPFQEASLANFLHRESRILEEVYTGEGIELKVELEKPLLEKFGRFVLPETPC